MCSTEKLPVNWTGTHVYIYIYIYSRADYYVGGSIIIQSTGLLAS